MNVSTTEYDLSDRLTSTDRMVAMSGLQAMLRVPLDQHRADIERGLRTAAMISGYRGSPVAGVDGIYLQDQAVFEANDIHFVSGVNEDLGATIVWGSQMAALESDPRYDGVLGLWYGKGPGLDRSGDAIRHANTSGVSPSGGVLAVAGDDPACKSSTIASASEWALADLALPTLYPGSAQDVLDFGRLGYELSRFCGAWVGFKLVTNVADAYATIDTDPARLTFRPAHIEVDGRAWRPSQSSNMLYPTTIALEEEMFTHRLEAAQAFVAAQGFDVTIGAGDARLGIVAAGTAYGEVRDALDRLGIGSGDDLSATGVRVFKPAMIWPLDPDALVSFAHGLDELIVVEDKRAFVETQIRDILYGRTNSPRVLGKYDDERRPLVPMAGAVTADVIVAPLRSRLARFVPEERLATERKRIPVVAQADLPDRTAYYCSGCPHNRSTVVPEGSVAAGGIGCHAMVLGMERQTYGTTHMGGEGAQWIGTAPFVESSHRFQNIGDGTLAHSGYLAIRQAISAGTNITYKVLYNGTVAMTGGQDAAGEMSVAELTRALEAEGAERIVVVADDPKKYDRSERFSPQSRVEHRDKLDEVQRELRDVSGVTVLIYDQGCAAELRRGRKRGRLETPTTRVMIDESICEGCGHCGEVSNCASVHPVQTPFGRKTQIHQESCNFDLTCLDGNCPAFVTVEIDPNHRLADGGTVSIPDGEMPAEPTLPEAADLVLIGIGGTGVVTVSQIIATAGLLDGKVSNGLDQTGLAQKGGTVVSNLRIGTDVGSTSNLIGAGGADTLLVFDLVSSMHSRNIVRADPNQTVAVVSTGLVPTGDMVSGRGAETFPDLQRFKERLDGVTRSRSNVWLDASGIAKQVFASQPAANVLMVGVAYQLGRLPVSSASIERAIELNGVSVETNTAAFRLGRRLAADPALLDHLDQSVDHDPTPAPLTGTAARLAATVEVEGDDELAEVLAWRIPELIDYQNERYAKSYVKLVEQVRSAERAGGHDSELSQVVARQLFKLMAYKDEYEVARLALKSDIVRQAKRRFGPEAKVSYRLHPPTLKAMGVGRKVAIPEAAGRKMFEGLARTKALRGKRFDPFGRTTERRLERRLIDDYRKLILRLIDELGRSPEKFERIVAIADLADQIRGYDSVKQGNVENYRRSLDDALADL